MAETFLMTPVPRADSLVRAAFARHNPELEVAPDEILAHITLLGPFLPPEEISPPVVAALRAVFAELDPFDFELVDVRSFEGGTVYLAPEPAARFVAMTERLTAEYPDVLPYGGRFDEVIPHLTVGFAGELADEAWLRERAAELLRVRSRATEVRLVEADERTFATRHRFALGAARRGPSC